MSFSVKILADSINANDNRLTTWELKYPRFVHSELMTHRLFSRNSASSRALPTAKLLKQIMEEPVIPIHIGANQKGMQADQEITEDQRKEFIQDLLLLRNSAATFVAKWDSIVHKQVVNRYVEPWMWITIILTATEFGNWFNLRYHKDAEPHVQHFAEMMWEQYSTNTPEFKNHGEWHLPLMFPEDEALSLVEKKKVSVGRCARVSYLTHDGKRDPAADIELCDRLAKSGHWSPFEHVATPADKSTKTANFTGWLQFRSFFPNEHQRIFNGPNSR